jgi:glucose/arabinose dehydrogenase
VGGVVVSVKVSSMCEGGCGTSTNQHQLTSPAITGPAITSLDFSAPVVEGFLPPGMLSDVTIGPDGTIYVSDDGVNSVDRFER